MVGRRIKVSGVVQGVGFRPWVYRVARRHGVVGGVKNGPEGVCIEAFAPPDVLDRFVDELRLTPPPAARIESLRQESITPNGATCFQIEQSTVAGSKRASIPVDLPTCAACLEDLFDPSNRRYRYAFTNCTLCGPRYTIAKDIPYDRASTTMASFPMCDECRREYEDPADRRFHAEPIACPKCGPTLFAATANRRSLHTSDPIADAAAVIRAGGIVAIKSLGGFQLACDATDEAAVRTLRNRKHREEKPFAVMVSSLRRAGELVRLNAEAKEALAGPEHPILLAERLSTVEGVAPSVAPDSHRLGVFLPYTPIHHLLFDAVDRPLVMTSANLHDQPMITTNEDAFEKLSGIADLFLHHDRDIDARADDSVSTLIRGRPAVFRRARGFVPEPIAISPPVEEPILAVGGQLKNTFCIAIEDRAYLGPHIGDLDEVETFEDFASAIERTERFLGVQPKVIVHDLHPEYASTRYARARPARRIAIQHHHAHVASVMAEHHMDGPVIGLAFDGTGLGTDGTIWGSEILWASAAGFERVARFRPITLPGGDAAVRQPWRIALSLIDDAFSGAADLSALSAFGSIPPRRLAALRRMMDAGLSCVQSGGLGRYFDALGVLALGRPNRSYEGQLPMALERAAEVFDPKRRQGSLPFDLDLTVSPWTVDLRPAVRQVVALLKADAPGGLVAARFHQTVVEASAQIVEALRRTRSQVPVVLSGGCFQNVRLTDGMFDRLGAIPILSAQRIPPNDGGLALGQIVTARAALSAEQKEVRPCA